MKPEKKKIILGVTGGIAAYKSADLCSKLTGAGFDVHVIMTASAQQLITQRCFLTLSRNPVICSLWDVPDWKPEHIELSESADLCVVAPCTANFIGKYTHGIADDALTTTALAFTGTMLLAPAMNCRMWRSPAVQDNCAILRKRGVQFIGPEKGRLACGDEDVGRMSEVPQIVEKIQQLLAGKK
ncbi:MAG: phosphopantothenoylcysteine decarboxylase [Lentisphaerae bacterium]|nr:phosphopantothenoylcysteine decarboxylase [Lentisphaerota bacterium]